MQSWQTWMMTLLESLQNKDGLLCYRHDGQLLPPYYIYPCAVSKLHGGLAWFLASLPLCGVRAAGRAG